MNTLEDTRRLMAFIEASPSPFHVVANVAAELEENGFKELKEERRYALSPGERYYVRRNNTSLIAFMIPTEEIKGYSIVSAHTDSPTFKLKPNPEVTSSQHYTTLNVEVYGGLLISPWFDRPLSIAGRAFVRRGGEVNEELVDFARDLVSIPSLAIHLNREANKGSEWKVQKELLPLFSDDTDKEGFLKLLSAELDCQSQDVIDYDLFLYNRTKSSIWGKDDAFFSSPRIDDLGCAASALFAMEEAQAKEYIPMICLFDNEEVGSGTAQGALSDFLRSTLDRIAFTLSFDAEEKYILERESFMLSADNGHAIHPSYREVADPVNQPVLNGGVLIKYSANQKYTTDGMSASYVKELCKEAGVEYQVFVNNSDIKGGSTLGNLSSQKVSIKCADVGIAQLAMHSPYECAGSRDTSALISLFRRFLSR